MAVPAWEMASNAYSTWYRRPSGEKMVVCAMRELQRPPRARAAVPAGLGSSCSCDQLTRESYLLDMVAGDGLWREWRSVCEVCG